MKPLAETLRPNSLEEYIGQKHLIGEGKILRNAIENNSIPSMILWGPPGVGKTTLANIIANSLMRPFYSLSAINSGVKDVRNIIEKARNSMGSILFIDEIHRFSKSQQDSLLGAVEQGIITLIGATTENPSFEVITPLLSRCQVYILKELERSELIEIIEKSKEYYIETKGRKLEFAEVDSLLRISSGDARKLLNAIEIIYSQTKEGDRIDNEMVSNIINQNIRVYDKDGEMHYDIISAFIKSIRGSDPNAAVYWLARMLASGEDPVFIARRLVILASEDIGLANPNALLIANSCFDSVRKIGMPESRIILSQASIYLASSPKSNSAYLAIDAALELVRKTGDLSVPMELRNSPTKLMKEIGYGKDYKYAHDHKDGFVEMNFMPKEIKGSILYYPKDNPREKETKRILKGIWKNYYEY